MKDYEEGDEVELLKPYRGYRRGEIVGYENYMYIVEFDSGMTAMNLRSGEMKVTSELKSKAMSLGNRLAPRMDGDRTAAFVQAWRIVKAGGLELTVKGVSFGTRQKALKRLAAYKPEQIKAVIVPEPGNPADPAALAVMVGVQNGRGLYRLGYVPRNMTVVASALGRRCPAVRVVSGTVCWYGKTTYGSRVALVV